MRDLTIALENRPGALAELGEALGNAGVSILGGGAFEGVAHFLFEDAAAARAALERAGIRVIAERDVVVQKLRQGKPGQLGKLARRMADANVNIEVAVQRSRPPADPRRRRSGGRTGRRRALDAGARAVTTPDISSVAALLGEPARARIVGALMGGVALTATELSLHAGVTPSTASSHLAKLVGAKILRVVKQGRHSYFHLHGHEVATLVESLHEFAARDTPARRGGPADPALAAARVCYDHLAGAAGVWLADALRGRNFLAGRDAFDLTPAGERFFRGWQLDVDALARSRRPLCRPCLDWSERRFHLGGALGAAILQRLFDARWARRERDSRAVTFSASGERSFRALFAA